LAINVSNKVYFEAWTDSQRVKPVDFVNASLKFSTTVKKVTTTTIFMDKNISTSIGGKGYFLYKPVPGMAPYIEITIQN
jgi:hypothetical protein